MTSASMNSYFFFFSSRRRHTRSDRDWSSDVCSSDLLVPGHGAIAHGRGAVLARIARDLEYLSALEDGVNAAIGSGLPLERSEERRVGKECRSRWSPYH